MTAVLLLAILAKATIIVGLALAGARLARHTRAAVRHVLFAAAFGVLLILPVASIVSPAVRVPVPAAVQEAIAPLEAEPIGDLTPSNASLNTSAAVTPATPAFAWPSLTAVLVAAWMAGIALCLLPVVVGLWQVRSLRRSGLPWRDGRPVVEALADEARIRRRVDVLLHESLLGPMTTGLMRPAIVLPMDAQHWADEDLRCAIVHELEHVRRGDWISHCLARIVTACYWFHPIVWIAWRQLSLEAERACDDAVLRRSEATAYADQLITLARRLSTSSSHLQLAMANRNDLSTRVVAVLDSGQHRGRAGLVAVGLISAVAALLAIVISPLRIVAATQASAASSPARPAFEVASIKPCAADATPPTQAGARATGPGSPSISPGRAYWECVTLSELITTTYVSPSNRLLNSLLRQRPGDPRIIRGGPAWVYADKFSIEAKAAGGADRETMIGSMLRALLEDRFQLKTHRATEERSMYALTVAKGGPKIKSTAPGDCRQLDGSQPPPSAPPQDRNLPPCGILHMDWNGGNRTLTATGTTLQSFTDGILSGSVMDRFVINRTGLEGKFNVPLEFAPDDNTPGGMAGLEWSRREGATPATGPSIFKALEELGLKLEPTKAPAGYLVIDHVEKPAGLSAKAPAAGSRADR